MAGSMPLADTAYKVAKVLGVTVEELIEEKATEIVEKHVKEGGISHVPKNPEEQHEVNRLLVILRDGNEEHLQIITHTISVLCGVRLWKKNGGIELREKPVSVSGKPERRLKIHLYKKERMSD
ncbi:MAG: hypothetical protein GY774_16465 [Planctomycetes bacterium]|nr:hypothetical protein [Planctomycetota bacterium]